MLSPHLDLLSGSLFCFTLGEEVLLSVFSNSFLQHPGVGVADGAVGPIFSLRKLRLRKLMRHVQDHTASKWQTKTSVTWQWAGPLEGQNSGCWAGHQGGWHLRQSPHHRRKLEFKEGRWSETKDQYGVSTRLHGDEYLQNTPDTSLQHPTNPGWRVTLHG